MEYILVLIVIAILIGWIAYRIVKNDGNRRGPTSGISKKHRPRADESTPNRD